MDFIAHLLQCRVEALLLFGGRMVAGVLRQLDAGQAEQRTAHQAGGCTNALQHIGFYTGTTGRSSDHGGVMGFADRYRQCREQPLQGGLGVFATATHAHFVAFANAQAHQANQAVARRRLVSKMQVRLAAETLGRLADQGGGAGMQAAPVGDAYAGAGFGAGFAIGVIHRCLNGGGGARGNVHQRLTDLDRLQRHRRQLKAITVGQDDQAHQALALTRNTVQVKPHQCLALAHPCAFLDQQGKAFAIEFHGVDAHMHQYLGTVIGTDGQGVPSAGDMDDHAVTGCLQTVVQRVDSDTVAHGAAGEHFVGDAVQGQHRPTQGGAEGQSIIIVGHGHGTHQEKRRFSGCG
ncbi:hypothetical protein [Pseudomonas sp. 24 E 13]|nr:hypothetical protein [Pseudomonas sp. 24 E 13]